MIIESTEKFPSQITIEVSTYQLVDVQRGGSAIYKDEHSYLRIGNSEKINKDLSLHKSMEDFRFPVAKLISEGKYQDLSYFIEESLGENCFGQIFKKETEQVGHVSDDSFNQFLNIVVQFTNAQLKTISSTNNWESFRHGIHLEIICQELPAEKDKILAQYNEVEERLKVFPVGILHGDFTPFNIYPKGVIDLEDSFLGPVGYDIGAIPTLQNWFPDKSDDQYYKVYKFTEGQRSRYVQTIDSIYLERGLPKLSDHIEDFNFTKGIWFAVRMQHHPKLQKFRYDLIKSLIEGQGR